MATVNLTSRAKRWAFSYYLHASGTTPFGLVGDIILGIVGDVIGGYILALVGVSVNGE